MKTGIYGVAFLAALIVASLHPVSVPIDRNHFQISQTQVQFKR
jgi:hypothetical protein